MNTIKIFDKEFFKGIDLPDGSIAMSMDMATGQEIYTITLDKYVSMNDMRDICNEYIDIVYRSKTNRDEFYPYMVYFADMYCKMKCVTDIDIDIWDGDSLNDDMVEIVNMILNRFSSDNDGVLSDINQLGSEYVWYFTETLAEYHDKRYNVNRKIAKIIDVLSDAIADNVNKLNITPDDFSEILNAAVKLNKYSGLSKH